MELARQVSVLGQDGGQRREAVEGRVRGQEEDEHGRGDHDVEAGFEPVHEHDARQLTGHRGGGAVDGVTVLVDVVGAGQLIDEVDLGEVGQQDDAHQHGDGQRSQHCEHGGGVAALRWLEGGHAVADGLDAGERGAAGGEGAREDGHEGPAGDLLRAIGPHDDEVRGLGLEVLAHCEDAEQADGEHRQHGDHEDIGRDGEGRPGVAGAAQVHQREEDDDADGGPRLVAGEERGHGLGVDHPGRHRHRDGEHVVDHERRGDGEPGVGAQVLPRDLVVTAATGVGVHGLAVGGHHDGHDHGDGESDLPGEQEARHPGQ